MVTRNYMLIIHTMAVSSSMGLEGRKAYEVQTDL